MSDDSQVWTKQEHDVQLAAVNEVVAELRRIAGENSFTTNERQTLVGELGNGVMVQVDHTRPMGRKHPMAYFTLFMGSSWDCHKTLNIQFNPNNGIVDDSSKFDDEGQYLGSGHIQRWHGQPDDLAFMADILTALRAATNWHKVAHGDPILLRRRDD